MIHGVPEHFGARKKQVSVRLLAVDHAKLERIAVDSGLSVNEVVTAFVARALKDGWSVKPRRPATVKPGAAPGVQGPPGSTTSG